MWVYEAQHFAGNFFRAAEMISLNHPDWDVVTMEYRPGINQTVVVHRRELQTETAHDEKSYWPADDNDLNLKNIFTLIRKICREKGNDELADIDELARRGLDILKGKIDGREPGDYEDK